MGLNDYLKKLMFDKRMVNQNLAQKTIQAKDVEKHLKNLEDVSSYGEVIRPEDTESSS